MFKTMDAIAEKIENLQQVRADLELAILDADTPQERAAMIRKLMVISNRVTALFVKLSDVELGCLAN